MPNIEGLGPWGSVFLALLFLLLGGGGGGFWVHYRKDKRQVSLDETAARKAEQEVLQQLRNMAKEAVAESIDEMKRQDEKHSKEVLELTSSYDIKVTDLERRVKILEQTLTDAGIPIPH